MDDLLTKLARCAAGMREFSPTCTAAIRQAIKRIEDLQTQMEKYKESNLKYAKSCIREAFQNDTCYHDELIERTVKAMREAPATEGFPRSAEYILTALLKEED